MARLKFFILPLIIVTALGFGANAQESGFTLTENQTNFAAHVKAEFPTVIDATWQSPMDLWVYAEGATEKSAKQVAMEVIMLSRTKYDQNFCVFVHDGNMKPLASKCSSP